MQKGTSNVGTFVNSGRLSDLQRRTTRPAACIPADELHQMQSFRHLHAHGTAATAARCTHLIRNPRGNALLCEAWRCKAWTSPEAPPAQEGL